MVHRTISLNVHPELHLHYRDPSLWFILLTLAGTTLLHYLTDVRLIPYHSVYRSLYYLPIAVAAVRYGRLGGMLTALATSMLYVPHVVLMWGIMPSDGFNDLLENGVFLFVGVLAGSLADRERIQRRRAEAAAHEVETSYIRLQEQGEQIRRAERQAALGRLAGGLAHEIRNPLAIVRAAAQVLGQQIDVEQRQYTDVMQSEVSRVDGLIEQLLRYAEPRLPAQAPVDVAALVADVVQICQPYANQHRLTLHTRASCPLSPLVGDGERLKQALLNLVLNAMQATPMGGAVIVEAGVEQTTVVLRVTDTGIGIPEDQLSRIFDPFFTTRNDGTGLGLTMVQQTAEEHGGQVTVGKNLAGGSIFTLALPATPSALDGKDTASSCFHNY